MSISVPINISEESEHVLSRDHDLLALFTQGWFGRSLGTCSSGGGGVRVGSYWRSFRSLSCCQMSCLSPPPPDGVSCMCGLLVLQLQQKPQSTKGEQRVVQCMPINKSCPLKVLFHNPGLMIEHAARLGGALFCSRLL